MSKFNSFEEFENSLKGEKIPQTDLNDKIIMERILNTKNKKMKMKPQIALAAILLLIAVTPILNNNISYSQMLKNIKESFYGKVVEYIDITDDDGGFQLVEYERSEKERERLEKASKIDTRTIYDEIRNQLEPGEAATLVHVDMYEFLPSSITVQQPIVFDNIEELREYDLDIAMPDYIPTGYKWDRASLYFIGKDYDKINARKYELIEEAREKDLPYLWEKLEDIKLHYLRLYYEAEGEGVKAGYSTISVYINLTDYPAANQALVEEGTDYKVDILTMGEKEVMRYTYDSDDVFKYYVFKVPNREYKTYEIWDSKDNTLPFKELASMIESFK